MKSIDEPAVRRVVVATGVSSVVTQLYIIRECLAQFQGNEFVIALILFNWLILGGAGTQAARGAARLGWKATGARLGWLSLLLAVLPILQIYAIRLCRDLFFVHGTSVGFYQTLAYTFLAMAPYGILVGFVLPYSLFVLRAADAAYPGTRVYIADNIGDCLGGALFAFVLVHWLTPAQGMLAANLGLLACAGFVFPESHRRRPLLWAGYLAAAAVLCGAIGVEPATLAPREGELDRYVESRYGRVTVHRNREQVTVFTDSVPVVTSQDVVAAEESVHYALAQVPAPETVLLIAAGSGMMAELAKYGLGRIDYVELNSEITRIQFDYGLIHRIPGLRVIHRDARAYLADTDTRYDAILVNLPEPETFQVNRFYTHGFFDLARRRLAPGGVLAFSVEGFDNYLAEPQRQKISSLYNTAGAVFSEVLMLPGQKIFFLCGHRPLTTGIPERLAAGGIATRYISRYFDGDLTADRIQRLNELVDPATPFNTDTAPRLMRIMFQQWFAKFSASPAPFLAVAGMVGLFCLLRSSREGFVLFSTGFTAMGSEILVVFAFQIFFGYIYAQIGLIVTVFLAGLMPGAWIGSRLGRSRRRWLAMTDLMLIALLCAFIAVLHGFGDRAPVGFYLLFGFLVSLVCGCQFPLALALRGDDDAAAVHVFSADLVGAAFGTLTTSVGLLPFAGVTGAVAGLIFVKLCSLVVVGAGHETVQQT